MSDGQLRALVERIERLEEDKVQVAEDIKEVYAEAKSAGFDVKILRKVVALRRKDSAARDEEQELIDLYMRSLGSLSDTPLGQSAVARTFPQRHRTDLEEAMGVP